MANLGTLIYTTLFGKYVGKDEFGNKYYKTRPSMGKYVGRYNKERRWVVFNGKAEATKIPPYWHGWMHYSIDEPPTEENFKKQYKWQKDYTPNLTGTDYRYLPKGHQKAEGKRDKATGDYEAWKPK